MDGQAFVEFWLLMGSFIRYSSFDILLVILLSPGIVGPLKSATAVQLNSVLSSIFYNPQVAHK